MLYLLGTHVFICMLLIGAQRARFDHIFVLCYMAWEEAENA